MKHSTTIKLLLGLSAIMMIFSMCTPKYTASFGPSSTFYKEKAVAQQQPQQEETPQIIVEEDVEEEVEPAEVLGSGPLLASTDKKAVVDNDATRRMKEIESKFEDGGEYSKEKIKDLSKTEKKQMLKALKKDVKEMKSIEKKEGINNQKIFIGIVVAAAGIVVAILASGSLGALAIIVGVALIAWGIIEQGGV